MNLYTIQRAKQEATPIALDLKVKGDKFLYYKRRVELLENTIKIFPIWSNSFVWGFLSFSCVTLFFLLYVIDKAFAKIPDRIPLFLFANAQTLFSKEYTYLYFFIPLINFIITFGILYKTYNTRRHVAYVMIVANILFTTLFLITTLKTLQMNYSLLP